jgi:sigma-B regulation protein RsbU (phosphoserine phosphatase)
MTKAPCSAVKTQFLSKSRLNVPRSLLVPLPGLMCVLFVCVLSTPAYGAESGTWQDGSMSLKDGWRMHPGDDPAYSRPNYDDTAWSPASLPQTHDIEAGWQWYRIRAKLPSSPSVLAIFVSGGAGTYEVFLNGEKVPGADLQTAWQVTGPRATSLGPLHAGGDVEIALRTFVPYGDLYRRDRGIWAVRVGTVASIATEVRSELGPRLGRAEPSVAINLLIAIAGLAVLTLFAAHRSHREYLWLGLYLLLSSVADGVWTLIDTGFIPLWVDCPANSAGYLGFAALVEFTFSFVRRRVSLGWRVYQFLLGIGALSTYLFYRGAQSLGAFDAELVLLVLPAAVLLPILLLVWYRRGNHEASWLIFPILLSCMTIVLYDSGWAASVLGWKLPRYLTESLEIGVVPLQVWDLANLLFIPAIGVVILLRFTRASREQANAAAEFGAAREIQRTLVPASLPAFPGYQIDAAYIPAAEVGGDLYQVIAKTDGSFLVVVGDVSGKGLKAAMSGAVAIGALRTLAAANLSPALLLEGLNRQITAGGHPGFITCLCVEMHPDGWAVFANAGHLSPYRNGEELDCGASLPLGLIKDADYREARIRLFPGDKLTLLTDGVVEARNSQGELFGFERTIAISSQSAQDIARTALEFGQDDDITLLTVMFES